MAGKKTSSIVEEEEEEEEDNSSGSDYEERTAAAGDLGSKREECMAVENSMILIQHDPPFLTDPVQLKPRYHRSSASYEVGKVVVLTGLPETITTRNIRVKCR